MAMHKTETLKLALKLAGIYILVQSILYIPSLALALRVFRQSNDQKPGSIAFLITFVLLLILGFWLIRKNDPKSIEIEEKMAGDLISLGLAVGGVIIFALAVRELPVLLSKIAIPPIQSTSFETLGINSRLENRLELIGNLIQLFLGAALFFRAKYFAKWVR